jgi:sugar phosphate isomerase/epimerase
MRVSRRAFIESATAAALLPVADLARAQPATAKKGSTFNGVVIGANSFCFPDRPIEQAIDVIAELGFSLGEVHPRHMEPSFGTRGGPMPAEDREKLRQWRMTTPMSHYEAVGALFKKKGIEVYAYNVNYRPDFSDGELERSLEATRALGARIVSGAGINADLARRLDPMAKRHDVRVCVHNHATEIRGEADFDAILKGLSDRMAINLDIGHYVAANADPVALLKRRHADILLLHVKDRKRENGPNLPFGQGDTPIRETLRLLREQRWKIPANIEWEVDGDRVTAVRQCLEFCRQALES